MAKAEMLMLTGYQRELTYRRDDGCFSAFGQQRREGSLWLTAFVLKTFAQAKDLIFIDDAVLSRRATGFAASSNGRRLVRPGRLHPPPGHARRAAAASRR